LFAVGLGASKTKCNTHELEHFLIRWDTVISGMGKLPDEDTLHTLFYKQVKDIEILDYDLKGYDRLPESERTIDKLRWFCDRVIQFQRAEDNQKKRHGQHSQNAPHVTAPGPNVRRNSRSPSSGRGRSPRPHGRSGSRKRSFSKSPSGHKRSKSGDRKRSSDRVCTDFLKGRCTRGAGCKYLHDKDGKRSSSRDRYKSPRRDDRARSPGKRSNSPSSSSKKFPCKLFAKGACHYGDRCKFSHETNTAPAPSSNSPNKPVRNANSPAPANE